MKPDPFRDRKSRTVYIEAPYKIETGEAERIAVDSTAKGGEGTGKCELFAGQTTSARWLIDRSTQ